MRVILSLIVGFLLIFQSGCISKPTGTQSIYLIQHVSSGKFVGSSGLTDDLNKAFSDLDKKKVEEIYNNLDKKEEYRIHEIWAVYGNPKQDQLK